VLVIYILHRKIVTSHKFKARRHVGLFLMTETWMNSQKSSYLGTDGLD